MILFLMNTLTLWLKQSIGTFKLFCGIYAVQITM